MRARKLGTEPEHLLLLLLLLPAPPPVVTVSLEALRTAAARSLGHSLDAWCIAYRCPGQSYACALDTECRRCLACLHACGSAEACSAACLYRCQAERLLTEFLVCAVVDHGCVELQAPSAESASSTSTVESEVKGSDSDCSADSLPAWGPPAPLAEARGRWFALRGAHPFHDCHACRTELLDDASVTGAFRFEDGPVKHARRVLASWPENGTLLLGLTKVGQAVTEVWRLSWLEAADRGGHRDLLLLSYCGTAGVWRYRGRLLLGRRSTATSTPGSGAVEPRFSCSVQHDAGCSRLLAGVLHDPDEL